MSRREDDVIEAAPSDADLIVAWLEEQAAKERDLLDSGRCTSIVTTQERWLVYKASAQGIRDGAWKKP